LTIRDLQFRSIDDLPDQAAQIRHLHVNVGHVDLSPRVPETAGRVAQDRISLRPQRISNVP
jgi:hypothetical protein